MNFENQKLRQDMVYLLGQIEAIRFPFFSSKDDGVNQAYYDLLDSIHGQYVKILKQTIGYEE